jgi:CBS domain-containing protein
MKNQEVDMQVKEIMTLEPASCTPETPLQKVAQLMIENDCGEIPVIDNSDSCIPVGVITDRDIVCRTVAKGLNPLEMTAGES